VKPLGMTNKFAFSEPFDPALTQYNAGASASHVPDGPVARVLVGDSTPKSGSFQVLESLHKSCAVLHLPKGLMWRLCCCNLRW
jgi:hypothetical protein